MSEKNEKFRKGYKEPGKGNKGYEEPGKENKGYEEPGKENLKELLERLYDWLIRLDYYKMLGVGINTTDEEVKEAYENKMKEIKQLIFKNTIKNHKKEECESLIEITSDEENEYYQFKDAKLANLYSEVRMLIEDAYVGIKNETNRDFYDKYFMNGFWEEDNNLDRWYLCQK